MKSQRTDGVREDEYYGYVLVRGSVTPQDGVAFAGDTSGAFLWMHPYEYWVGTVHLLQVKAP